MLKVAVQILIKDNRKYLADYFFPYFNSLEKKLKYRVKLSYFFLENDSCDESHRVIERFIKSRSGLLKTSAKGSQGGGMQKSASVSPEARAKMHKMATIRTEINNLIPHDEFDYIYFVDSDIKFEAPVFENFIEILEQQQDIGQVTANGIIRNSTWEGLYYDTWACEFSNGGTPHGHSRSIDTFPRGCTSKMIKNVYGFMIPINHPCRIKVNAAYGGAAMVRSHLMKDFIYDAGGVFKFCNVGKVMTRGASCEHKSLCKHILEKDYKILIDPASVCTWKREPDPVERRYMMLKDQLPVRSEQIVGKL